MTLLPKYQTLGYPQADVLFRIDNQAQTIYMEDLDQGGRSLTNDVNNVLCRIVHYQRLLDVPIQLTDYTIFYKDSCEDICGISVHQIHHGQANYSFYPIRLPTV